MAEFTLLKIQLDESSFTANAPFSGGTSEETPEAETEESGDFLGLLLRALLGLLALVALAFAVKKWRASGDETGAEGEMVELDDIDV